MAASQTGRKGELSHKHSEEQGGNSYSQGAERPYITTQERKAGANGI